MIGPYRKKLLGLGAFGSLLRAALTTVMDAACDRIIQQAAAIGVMYLSTQVRRPPRPTARQLCRERTCTCQLPVWS
jgi:hypothetical protein